MKFNSFLKECQDKEVFKKLSIYTIVCWLLLQAVGALWKPLGLPANMATFLLIAVLVGFPLYIFYIWKFQIEPAHKKEPEIKPTHYNDPQPIPENVEALKEKKIRQLAAVMFTDIEGYTALMQADEELAAKVRIRHREVFQAQHQLYHGEIIQYYGDGTLSIFKSAIEAVSCAIALQRNLQEGEPPVHMRIGLHMGDIVHTGTDVYGDGVNIASRIESMGVKGGILLSAKLNDELKNHHQISTQSLGFFELKNVAHPVEIFSVTNPGIKVPIDLEFKERNKSSFQRYYLGATLTISLLVALMIGLIIRNNFFMPDKAISQLKSSDKIGILHFGNNTGDPEYEIVGKMAADWIMHGITEKGLAQVVSPEVVSNYTSILKASINNSANQNVLQEYFKPSRIISGNYYLNKNELIFQCSITDGELIKTLISLEPVSCNAESPLECIEALKQRILGFLITNEKEDLNLQETPPTFEAYQYLLLAKTTASYQENYLELLEKAIKADPNYFEPKVLRVAYYYFLGEFKRADSLLKQIPSQFGINKRQQNLLKLYEALLKGDNKGVFKHTQNEYNLAPFDLSNNASMMIVAMQYVNRADAVDSIYNEVDMTGMDLETCFDCLDRIYTRAISELALNKNEAVIQLLTPYYSLKNFDNLLKPLISANVRSGMDVENLLEQRKLILTSRTYLSTVLHAGAEYLLQDNQEKADMYFDQIINSEMAQEEPKIMAMALYYKKDFEKAIPYFESLIQQKPEDLENYGYLATAYQETEHADLAKAYIEKLDASRSDYQFGTVDYILARYYASQNEDKAVLNHLLKAAAAGYTYTPITYQNDPDLYIYLEKPEFKRVMNYWK